MAQIFVGSKTQYKAQIGGGMPRHVRKEAQSMIWDLVWDGGASHISGKQMTLERALGGKGILDLTIWDEAIAMNVTKSYLDFGISWPHWADLADKIIANHCIKKPETNKDARINTFLQNWNTNLSSLPNLLQYMVGATEKYGFLFKDVRPSKQVRNNMPLWYHPVEIKKKQGP
ncbi:hypothetical protein C8J56DRAFT_785256 [Mycena floridula]|nr:hypothetical protein C8J56DRAFT_785256 [Mycena floridula]